MSFYVLVLHKLRRKSQKEIEMRNLGKNSQKLIPLRAISYSTTVWTILSNCARLPFCLRFHQQLKYVDKSMMSLQNFYTINFLWKEYVFRITEHGQCRTFNIRFHFPGISGGVILTTMCTSIFAACWTFWTNTTHPIRFTLGRQAINSLR